MRLENISLAEIRPYENNPRKNHGRSKGGWSGEGAYWGYYRCGNLYQLVSDRLSADCNSKR